MKENITIASPLPIIAVDIGNTSIQFGVFAGETVGDLSRPSTAFELASGGDDFDRLKDWIPAGPGRWLVASVHRPTESRLRQWVERHQGQGSYHRLGHEDLPLTIDVEQPECVGMDRLVGAVAANRLRKPERPVLIIDAGSAITVDLVSAQGAFLGGAILPGMNLSAATLADQTDQLPLVPVDPDNRPEAVGKSTAAAIRSGLYWGTVGALRELIARISTESGGQPQVFITGGDAMKLAPLISDSALLVPHLVLAGIVLAGETK